jgi:hypothetical protein
VFATVLLSYLHLAAIYRGFQPLLGWYYCVSENNPGSLISCLENQRRSCRAKSFQCLGLFPVMFRVAPADSGAVRGGEWRQSSLPTSGWSSANRAPYVFCWGIRPNGWAEANTRLEAGRRFAQARLGQAGMACSSGRDTEKTCVAVFSQG